MFKSPPTLASRWWVTGAILSCLVACDPSENPTPPRPTAAAARIPALAAAWIDAAISAPADRALALLSAALKVDDSSTEARELAVKLLRETRWSLPTLRISHPFPIEQIHCPSPHQAWVSLLGPTNTTVRWNLDSLQIESVLFPIPATQTRSLTFDPTQRSVIVERASFLLLCDAVTLKPIRDLGLLPAVFTPTSVIVFSPDGLLMAHPSAVSPQDPAIVWHLRDCATGEILRSSEPLPPSAPQPLSATLDRRRLRVIHTDGSFMELPVSPIAPPRTEAAASPITLLHAQFSTDGASVSALVDQGPHRPPSRMQLGTDPFPEAASMALRFPWTRSLSIWHGLMKDTGLRVTDSTLEQAHYAPIHADSPLTAIAFQADHLVTGEQNGQLTRHQLLPLPNSLPTPPPAAASPAAVAALEQLSHALSGMVFENRKFTRLTAEQRQAALKACDFIALRQLIPELDFSPVDNAIGSAVLRQANPEALRPLTARLDAQLLHGTDLNPAQELAVALESDQPDTIEACVQKAAGLPPLLRKIAQTRCALLRDQRATALAEWPEIFPDLSAVRLREDWLGWEQADFQPALTQIQNVVQGELTALRIPENSTPEQRAAVIAHLSDPETVTRVGKRRFVDACLAAALTLADLKQDTATAFQLANFARTQGAPPEPCLRVEAIALTNLGDFKNAHTRWIELITEHPVAAQLPGDYAEAAYTSFENSDPRQAMEILTTGLHRFPHDGNFALRAGWVALLTGNSEKAYRFLREGQRIGFPPPKLENATALLTIAASQSGAEDDATVYFNDLLRIDPAWNDPATLDGLSWPEDLKSTLRQFMR